MMFYHIRSGETSSADIQGLSPSGTWFGSVQLDGRRVVYGIDQSGQGKNLIACDF